MAVYSCVHHPSEDDSANSMQPLALLDVNSCALDPLSQEISLKLLVALPEETGCSLDNSRVIELPALTDDTIRSIRLRLLSDSCASNANCLFFGDKQVLQQDNIGQLVASIPGYMDYLHIFACMSDVESVEVTSLKQSFSMTKLADTDNSSNPVRSALTASLQSAASNAQNKSAEDRLLVRSNSYPETLIPKIAPSHAIVHLMFKKTAKAEYHANSNTYEITISGSDTPEDVIRRVEATSDMLLCQDHDLVYRGQVLQKGKPLASYGVGRGSVLEIVPVEPANAVSFPDGSPLLSSPEHKLYDNWQRAREGLASGTVPKLASIGAGGSYFLRDSTGQNVAVFKPRDEEARAVNNPKGLSTSPDGEGLRKGTRPGEGAVREVAAYLLDHGHFAGVPPTAMVACSVTDAEYDVKIGSLQLYVPSDGDCEECGTSFFPTSEVHKIAMLDIRLANTDRNGGNILVKKVGGVWKLIPIDHGYTLPETFEDIGFEWLYWPQAAKPFSPAELEYIDSLNAEKDIAILSAHNCILRPECMRVLRVCTMLLKKGARLGLTPYQIGAFMSRDFDEPSGLELLHHQAMRASMPSVAVGALLARHLSARGVCGASVGDDAYMQAMSDLLDEKLGELAVEAAGELGSPQ